MRKLIIFKFCVLVTLLSLAQSPMDKGQFSTSVGYGSVNIGRSVLKLMDGHDNFQSFGLGPAHFKFEYGLTDIIGIGASVNYNSFGADFTDIDVFNFKNDYKVTFSSYSFLARVNFHFSKNPKFDPYFGLGFGYRTGKWRFETTAPTFDINIPFSTNFIPYGFETTLGLRAYLTDNIGLYMEAGLAKALIQGGLVVRI